MGRRGFPARRGAQRDTPCLEVSTANGPRLIACPGLEPGAGVTMGGAAYVRFMDDILVLAPSRWKLRRAVKAVNEVLASLDLEKHPDKTFIGRIEKGFDFLGYHFGPQGLSVAKGTFQRFIEKASRLYEQERERPDGPALLGVYVRRWAGWAGGGLTGVPGAASLEEALEKTPGFSSPACADDASHPTEQRSIQTG